MKFLLALLFLTNLCTNTFAHDHPSVHGMLIVGKNTVYLSHLPMFHAPHDYQVIVEAEFSTEGKTAYLDNLESSSEKIYTLVPEAFVLPEMIKNPRPFKAQIYKGHFERDGVLIAENVTVEIKKVIYFKKFNPLDVKPIESHFLLFGNKQEQFLAHAISQRPDFDQILKIDVVDDLINGYLPLVFENISNNNALEGSKNYQSEKFNILTQDSIYLELGDLQ